MVTTIIKSLSNISLYFYPSINVIVCKYCQCSITLKSLQNHFIKYHNVHVKPTHIRNLNFNSTVENISECKNEIARIKKVPHLL